MTVRTQNHGNCRSRVYKVMPEVLYQQFSQGNNILGRKLGFHIKGKGRQGFIQDPKPKNLAESVSDKYW